MIYGVYHFVSWLKGFNNPVAYSLKNKIDLLLSDKKQQLCYLKCRVKPCFHVHILLVIDEIFVHEKCSDKICSPQKSSIDTFLVIKVTISYDNFIAIDPMKNIWGTI